MAAGWRADKEKATVKEDEDRPKRRRTGEQHSVYERVSLSVKLIFRHLPLWSLIYLFILFFSMCSVFVLNRNEGVGYRRS